MACGARPRTTGARKITRTTVAAGGTREAYAARAFKDLDFAQRQLQQLIAGQLDVAHVMELARGALRRLDTLCVTRKRNRRPRARLTPVGSSVRDFISGTLQAPQDHAVFRSLIVVTPRRTSGANGIARELSLWTRHLPRARGVSAAGKGTGSTFFAITRLRCTDG